MIFSNGLAKLSWVHLQILEIWTDKTGSLGVSKVITKTAFSLHGIFCLLFPPPVKGLWSLSSNAASFSMKRTKSSTISLATSVFTIFCSEQSCLKLVSHHALIFWYGRFAETETEWEINLKAAPCLFYCPPG